MKKQEMIDFILQEERELYSVVEESIRLFGFDSEITQTAITRWAAINKLSKKLGVK